MSEARPSPAPPRTEAELLERAESLAGCSLGEVAARFGATAPADLRRAKGWVGTLLERALGATASSRAAPDFESLGIELKTLPVNDRGKPCESTFVCTIELSEIGDMEWQSSRVWKKLARVLWVPVQGERRLPVATRLIGTPFLWSPDEVEMASLRDDWEELAGIIGRGDVESIDGRQGRCLQIRPKAPNGSSRRRGVDRDGVTFAVLPRGFYLRATFTERLLRRFRVTSD